MSADRDIKFGRQVDRTEALANGWETTHEMGVVRSSDTSSHCL